MQLDLLRQFAETKMAEFGLTAAGWTFRFDDARRRFGVCRFDIKVISLSRHLVALNQEAECHDTVLHEIAHALAGPGAGHGRRWKAMCRRVGALPERCFDGRSVVQPAPRYWAVCPRCGHRAGFHRIPSRERACASCCRTHNGGAFDRRFLLRIEDARTGDRVPYATPAGIRISGICPSCRKTYLFRKRIRAPRACGSCCREYAEGRYDERFRLRLQPRRKS